ncbi:MAG: sulfurtransferase [Devosia sp. 67-54]|uniref:sulfurtransferase n=1 Tax=unclassified Devosia TaxID=196773 RepID=UPI00095E52FD|nr:MULTISPECIES: sulfurtransferase [unclassified Devosia]MBN9307259.1 sulfurtransferase [Devosia sp.]OJX19650.1 MAG: sulfurtransferase [Devosia sp. 67-54]
MRFNVLATALVLGLAAVGSAHAERLTDQPLVDAAWLNGHLGQPGLVIIDIRDKTKDGAPYAAGHVPGAVEAQYSAYGWRASIDGAPGLLPKLDDISARIAALGVNDDTQVVIVPDGSSISEFGGATRVYWTFKVLGHDNVTILDGGYKAWTAAGEPVSTDVVTPKAGTFVAKFRPELRAEVAEVQQAIKDDVNLIDARSVAQFIGKEKTSTVKELGTIPTAVNINFDKFWDPQTNRFASKAAIEALVQQAGLVDKDGVITFCNTGHLASIAWFGLSEVAGLKHVRLYDGSMSQWTLDPARPVVVQN